jgi:hypothetical protein
MKKDKNKKSLTIKDINKSNVWDLQENDILRLLENGMKDAEVKEDLHRYIDIIRSAFMVEESDTNDAPTKLMYEKKGYKMGVTKIDDTTIYYWAIKKRPIMRVTDLTYENIHHISAAKLIEVLGRNFGGGWESLSQSIQDIIESGFDISTSTLPKDRVHKAGGMYEKKINDGYEVLEIPKGSWIEAIFAKEKPEIEHPHINYPENSDNPDDIEDNDDNDENDDKDDENEFNYRTTFEIAKEDEDGDTESDADFITESGDDE